jgi:hypothetical protein
VARFERRPEPTVVARRWLGGEPGASRGEEQSGDEEAENIRTNLFLVIDGKRG